MKKLLMGFAVFAFGLFFASAAAVHAWPWSSTYTVNTSVWPGYSVGYQSIVTLYGINGYYGHKQNTDGAYGNHTLSFANVPGGSSVYNRIDVDLLDGTHAEYYNQHIYNAFGGSVSFTYNPL